MNILFTLTAYPPTTRGAQHLMHQIARQLSNRHSVQVVTQWDTNRTDWLLGTTLRAPSSVYEYEIDGIPVQRISLSEDTRRGLIPWVLLYYPLQGMALKYISAALAKEIEPKAESVDLIHNCRIGREGLSYASYQVAQQHDMPFVLTPVHHPRWSGWLHCYYLNLYRKADAIIALTESERSLLSSLGVAEKRLFVTGMGPVLSQNEDALHFRAVYHLGEDPIVLFLGQKYAYKGIEPLLKAAQLVWQKHPQTRFVLIGPRTNYSEKLFKTIKDNRLLELGTVNLDTKTDAIASYDAIEHIYDSEGYFRKLKLLPHQNLRVVFAPSANIHNPLIRWSRMKGQLLVENQNRQSEWGHKERDALESYSKIRRRMIATCDPQIKGQEIDRLTRKTRGLVQRDIEKYVREYQATGKISYQPDHPTNTCDPFTGNWHERLMDIGWIKRIFFDEGFEIEVKPGYLAFAPQPIKQWIKVLLNVCITLAGSHSLFLSPYYLVNANLVNGHPS